MNKKEMIKILNESGLKNSLILTSGGALIMYGLKNETNDIDVICSDMNFLNSLKRKGYKSEDAALGGELITYKNMDIHFQDINNLKVNIIEGIVCLDISEIANEYKRLSEVFSSNKLKSEKYYNKYLLLIKHF